MTKKEKSKLKSEVLEAFRFFADSKFTGNDPVLPISRVIFGAEGPIVDPPSFEFLGFGVGPEGEAFSQTGSLDLAPIFGEEWLDDDVMKEKFDEACLVLREILKDVAKSDEFEGVPKTGHVVFALSISDQFQTVLCRIAADGTYQLPPEKK